MLSNCGPGEDSWESLDNKEIKPVNPKGNQPWIFIGRTDTEAEAPILWPPGVKSWLAGKKIWCWERLAAGGEGAGRGWDGWMASPTLWTWVWVSFGSWWWTGRPGVLQSMGSQRGEHDWATQQQKQKDHFGSEVLVSKSKMFQDCQHEDMSNRAPKRSHWQSNKTNNYSKKRCLTRCSHLKTFNDLRGFKVDSRVWTHSWIVCSISSGL